MNLKSIVKQIQSVGMGFLIPGILVVVSLILIFLIVLPQFYKITQVSDEKKTLKQNLDDLDKRIAVLSDYGTQKNLIRDYEELLLYALPAEKKVPTYMTQVEQMALESGFQVENVSFGVGSSAAASDEKGALPSNAKELVVNATFQGPLENILDFLKICENASRIVFPRTFRSVFEEGDQNEGGIYNHTFGLVSYYLPEADASTTASSAQDLQSTVVQNTIKNLRKMKQYKDILSQPTGQAAPQTIIDQSPAPEQTPEATPSGGQQTPTPPPDAPPLPPQ